MVDKFLDRYPGILGVSEDTKGLIEGTVMLATEINHALETDLLTKNLRAPKLYLERTEVLGYSAQELCLDILPNLSFIVAGSDVRSYNMEIFPGNDTEAMGIELECRDIRRISMDIKEELAELAGDYVKVYRYEKNNGVVSDNAEDNERSGLGVCSRT